MGPKDTVGAKWCVGTCHSETSTLCERESVTSLATSTDSCSWEDHGDVDASTRHRPSLATSETWEDDFGDDEKLERVKWLARFCRKSAPVQRSDPLVCECGASAEDAPCSGENSTDPSHELWSVVRVQDCLASIMEMWSVMPSDVPAASLRQAEMRQADADALAAEEVLAVEGAGPSAVEDPTISGWYTDAMQAWKQLPSQMQQALSLW